jgi:hypothetical protein
MSRRSVSVAVFLKTACELIKLTRYQTLETVNENATVCPPFGVNTSLLLQTAEKAMDVGDMS